MSDKRLIDGDKVLVAVDEIIGSPYDHEKLILLYYHLKEGRFDIPQSMYEEECDWCGGDTLCHSVSKPDGMPGDICLSCLIFGKHLPNQGEAARLREALERIEGLELNDFDTYKTLVKHTVKQALSSHTEDTNESEHQRGWNAALRHAEAEPLAVKQVREFRRQQGETVETPGITDGQ